MNLTCNNLACKMKVYIQGKNGPKLVDLNRRKAIRERCMDCTGWAYSRVSSCEFDDCPLHPFRSGKGKQDAKARAKNIRKYCLWCMSGSLYEVSKCPSTDCPLFPYRKTRTERASKIQALPKKGHIGVSSEDKTEAEYLSA